MATGSAASVVICDVAVFGAQADVAVVVRERCDERAGERDAVAGECLGQGLGHAGVDGHCACSVLNDDGALALCIRVDAGLFVAAGLLGACLDGLVNRNNGALELQLNVDAGWHGLQCCNVGSHLRLYVGCVNDVVGAYGVNLLGCSVRAAYGKDAAYVGRP